MAQPALSQQIKQLERELGVQLFDRTSRRVEPTESGQQFEQHARTVLSSVDRAVEDMAMRATGRAGRVIAGFIGTATYDVLPRVAREVRTSVPGVRLELRGEMLSPQLLEGLLDHTYDVVVLRPDRAVRPEIDLRSLRVERLVAVLPADHRLARRSSVDLAELAEEPFVMHPSGHRSSMHEQVRAACAAAGFAPVEVSEVSETATLVVFVAAGLGVALVPEPVRSLGLEGVVYVALTQPPEVELALALRRGEPSAAVRRVASVVTSCLG
jgi:DNA-binding transcriptional LysR family regulator